MSERPTDGDRLTKPHDRTQVVPSPSPRPQAKTLPPVSGPAWRPFRFENLEKVSRAEALLTSRLEWLLPSAAVTGGVSESIQLRLKELFGAEVRLLMDYVHVVRPRDLRKRVTDPTFLAVLAPAPHKTRGFLEVELSLAHAMIDELLGGGGETVALRPLTDIEEGVMSFVVLEALKALAPNLEPGLPRLRLEGIAKRVEDALALVEEEPNLVVVQLKATLGPHAGFVRLFVPQTVIGMTNPPQNGAERRARRLAETQANLSRLAGVKTWMRAEVGRAEISGRDLAELRAGDVVLVDELSARVDRGEAGTARLKVGLGHVARLDTQLFVHEGRYKARILGLRFGEEPRHTRGPSDSDEEAAEALAEAVEAPVADGPADDAPAESGQSERPNVEDPGTLKSQGAELLNDIPLQIAVELARVPVTAEDVVSLKVGQVVDLSRVPGEPVELSVNSKIIARGELVEVEGHLGVRILSLTG